MASRSLRRSLHARSQKSEGSFCDASTITTGATSSGTTAATLPPPLAVEEKVTFVLKEQLWTLKDQSHAVKRSDGRKIPSGINVRVRESTKPGRSGKKTNKLILRNDEKRVMALCSKEVSSAGVFTYKILSMSSSLPGQKPAKRTSNSRMGLFDWVELHGMPGAAEYTVGIWNGTCYIPSYTCERGAAMQEYLFITSEGIPCGSMSKAPPRIAPQSVLVSVLAGFDPCLMLGVATMIDDLNYAPATGEGQSLQELAVALSAILNMDHCTTITGSLKEAADGTISSDDHPSGSSTCSSSKGHANASRRSSRAA